MPLATFVCPTYNGAGYLAETIESIRRQSVEDWELVVVNDGSDDTTKLLMDWYEKEDTRIRSVHLKKNNGCVEARNIGNEEASTDLILVIDHDDLCHSERLKETLSHFKRNPDTDIFHTGWIECDIYGNPVTEPWKPLRITKKLFKEGKMLFCHSTAAMPRQVSLKHPYRLVEGRTDDHVALEDWLGAGLKFRTLNKPLCGVRRLPMGQMQDMRTSKGLPQSWIE